MTSMKLRLVSRPRSNLANTLDKAARLIDPDSGIISLLYEAPNEPDSPAIFGFGSVLADTSLYGVEDFGLINGSTSVVREHAMAGAIGEAVERYASRIVPYGDLVLGSHAELAPAAVNPQLLVLYEPEQYRRDDFPYRRLTLSDPIFWVRGYSLTQRCDRLVPAASVFMHSLPQEQPFVQQTTNGLACGSTPEEAILSGIYEVIERDALMKTWFARTSPPKYDLETASDTWLLECLRRFAVARVPVDLMDITTDVGVPTVLAAMKLSPACGGAPVFSSASGPSQQRAAQHALEELFQCMLWIRAMVKRRSAAAGVVLEELKSTEDHVMWAADPQHSHRVAFLTDSAKTLAFPSAEPFSEGGVLEEIDECVRLLDRCAMETVVVDVTPPDIAEVGLSVFRTLVLGSLPLYFGSGLWRVASPGHRRLPSVAINHCPHPFP